MAVTRKTQQVVKMTTLGNQKSLGHMALQQNNLEVSFYNAIKLKICKKQETCIETIAKNMQNLKPQVVK